MTTKAAVLTASDVPAVEPMGEADKRLTVLVAPIVTIILTSATLVATYLIDTL